MYAGRCKMHFRNLPRNTLDLFWARQLKVTFYSVNLRDMLNLFQTIISIPQLSLNMPKDFKFLFRVPRALFPHRYSIIQSLWWVVNVGVCVSIIIMRAACNLEFYRKWRQHFTVHDAFLTLAFLDHVRINISKDLIVAQNGTRDLQPIRPLRIPPVSYQSSALTHLALCRTHCSKYMKRKLHS